MYTGSYGDLGNLIKSHMNNLTSYPLSTSPLAMMSSVLPADIYISNVRTGYKEEVGVRQLLSCWD